MLTIEQLLKATDPDVINNTYRNSLNLVHVRKEEEEDNNNIYVTAVVTTRSGPQKCAIHVLDNTIELNSPCIVYCSCKYFIIKLKAVLALNKATAKIKTRNKTFHQVSPNCKPGLCTHLATLIGASLVAESKKKKQEQKPQDKAVKISPKLKKKS